MRKTLLALLVPVALLAACAISVPSPDLSIFEDSGPGGDDGTPGDPGRDPGRDPGTDPGRDEGSADHTPPGDPGVPDDQPADDGRDPGPVDTGYDPGPLDTGTDLNETPMPGNYTCVTNQGCLSGECVRGTCTCHDVTQCDAGHWCDNGDTKWTGTGRCLPPRSDFAGCKAHAQCESGACDPQQGYCAKCATGGVECATPQGCCGGQCTDYCLGCPAAPPPAPDLTFCLSGCYDALTEFCGVAGPEGKRAMYDDCQFNDTWCKTGYCMSQPDGATSWCACRVDEDCGGGGAVCINGGCAIS